MGGGRRRDRECSIGSAATYHCAKGGLKTLLLGPSVLIEMTTSGSIVRTGDLLAVRGDIVTEEMIDEVHIEYS